MKKSEKSPSQALADTLKEMRHTYKFSQEELANRAGLSKNAISLIENEERWPRSATLDAIAKAFGVSSSKLIEPHTLSVHSSKTDHIDEAAQLIIDRVESKLKISDEQKTVLEALERSSPLRKQVVLAILLNDVSQLEKRYSTPHMIQIIKSLSKAL